MRTIQGLYFKSKHDLAMKLFKLMNVFNVFHGSKLFFEHVIRVKKTGSKNVKSQMKM